MRDVTICTLHYIKDELGHVARMGKMKNTYTILVEYP